MWATWRSPCYASTNLGSRVADVQMSRTMFWTRFRGWVGHVRMTEVYWTNRGFVHVINSTRLLILRACPQDHKARLSPPCCHSLRHGGFLLPRLRGAGTSPPTRGWARNAEASRPAAALHHPCFGEPSQIGIERGRGKIGQNLALLIEAYRFSSYNWAVPQKILFFP
jgi:hypothetical protein